MEDNKNKQRGLHLIYGRDLTCNRSVGVTSPCWLLTCTSHSFEPLWLLRLLLQLWLFSSRYCNYLGTKLWNIAFAGCMALRIDRYQEWRSNVLGNASFLGFSHLVDATTDSDCVSQLTLTVHHRHVGMVRSFACLSYIFSTLACWLSFLELVEVKGHMHINKL